MQSLSTRMPIHARRLGQVTAIIALLGASGLAVADAERLEADLRALFAGGGTLSLGEVSGAMLRSRLTAEDIVYETDEGERLLIDRYIVSGDYDAPDEVTLEGLRVEDSLTELSLVNIERIVLGEPSHAVFPFHIDPPTEKLSLGSLVMNTIELELASEWGEKIFAETPLEEAGQGRMTIDQVRGEAISPEAVGMFEMEGIAATFDDFEELGSGSLTLESLRLEGLTGLDTYGEETLASLVMRDFAVEASEMVGSFALFDLDGDFEDGKGGARLEGLHLDLARMIERVPPEDRAALRMASNVLTDGSGQLNLDATLLGNWQEKSGHTVLVSDSQIHLHDALHLLLDINLPVQLPPGMTPAEAMADPEWLETATLLGGDIRLNLGDQGLFSRLAVLGATMEGISEAQYIEQARTQAQGFGMMFGPEVQALLLGLVELLDGSAKELDLRVTLPAESSMSSLMQDPLGAPEKLKVKVETK